jgi:hypothetical protein
MDTRTTPPVTAPRTARAKAPWPAQLWVRRLHLYGGVLFAPAILFFALTGAVQVFDLHKPRPGAGYRPPDLVLRLAALHKDQTFALPHKDEGGRKAKAPAGDPAPPRAPKPMGLGQALLKAFAAAAAIGLAATTGLGLYMAYRSPRDRWLVSALLAAGVAVPILLAALG